MRFARLSYESLEEARAAATRRAWMPKGPSADRTHELRGTRGKAAAAAAGIAVPRARSRHAAEAATAAAELGPCVVKAQVPTGKRGKAGGIKLAARRPRREAAAAAILGMRSAGTGSRSLLVEAQVPIARELYAAVL